MKRIALLAGGIPNFKYIIKKSNCNDITCCRIEDIFLNLFGYFIGNNLLKINF